MFFQFLLPWLFLLAFAFFLFFYFHKYLVILSQKYKLVEVENIARRQQSVQDALFPLRVQASERLVLFLERIRPMALVTRHLESSFLKQQLQMKMLHNIRDEFEHNLSQQIFVGESVWQTVKAAREDVSQKINVVMSGLPEEATAAEAAGLLIAIDVELIDRAIKMIKEEMTRNL